ncbi:MAG: HAD-IA family hydrolase [Chloroflexi bacterium]|nr:HAD-IA family hydrolase [Chloroflexota bacterium]
MSTSGPDARSHRRYEVVFFDVGDTLLHVGDPIDGYARALAAAGLLVDRDSLLPALAAARRQFLLASHVGPAPDYQIDDRLARERRARLLTELLVNLGQASPRLEEMREAIDGYFVGTDFFRLYPDALPALNELRDEGYRLGIISNWDPRLKALCANHGFAGHIERIFASEAVGYAKPSARLFRHALAALGVEADRAVHVGDDYNADVLGARSVGMDAILLDRANRGSARHSPTISTLADLPALLSR